MTEILHSREQYDGHFGAMSALFLFCGTISNISDNLMAKSKDLKWQKCIPESDNYSSGA